MSAPNSGFEPPHDLSAVSCGLVPAIRAVLDAAPPDGEVRILVRQGMVTELVNAFGCGGAWTFTLERGLSADLAVFVRAREQGNPLELF